MRSRRRGTVRGRGVEGEYTTNRSYPIYWTQGKNMVTTESPETRSANNRVPAGEWQELLGEILPSQGLWTEEQYLVLTDHRNRLIEFTDGFLEVLPMPTDKHQSILKFMFLAFFRFVEIPGGKVQFSPLRLQ